MALWLRVLLLRLHCSLCALLVVFLPNVLAKALAKEQ
jgi:hypothetical protein